MLGPLRTLVSVAFLVVIVWAAFAIKLGDRTFADHMDRIGETPEAKALLDGARARVRPALEEVKQRLMGEYVEAPTYVPAAPRPAVAARAPRVDASTADAGRVPGQKVPGALTEPPQAAATSKLPGRRPTAPAPASAPRERPAGAPHKTRSSAEHAPDAGKLPGRRAQ